MYGNDLPAIGGFGLAAGRPLPLGTGLAMLVGLSAVMAGACVANNLLDQRLDALMTDGGIADCGKAQNCVEVCPKEIPLVDSISVVARDTTKRLLFGWLLK